jgi:PIN domain nuclease of toxin-antitoxin system
LDTHIALWLDSGDERLRPTTRALIADCRLDGGVILVSAVTAWEIAMLTTAGRIELDCPVSKWVQRFLDQPGVRAVPLLHRAAARSYIFQELEHRDPADRLLIATAAELRCPLVTYDSRITRFAARHGDRYGFAVAG